MHVHITWKLKYRVYFYVQILQKGHFCENQIVTGGGAEKYGRMLTRLFEQKWQEGNLSKSPLAILNFTLSWSPFIHFLDMFCKCFVLVSEINCDLRYASKSVLPVRRIFSLFKLSCTD